MSQCSKPQRASSRGAQTEPMACFYFWLLALGIAVLLAMVLGRPELCFEYPFFMGLTFGVFILPQAVSLLRLPGAAPEHAVASVLLMASLCFTCCVVGYWRKPSREIVRAVSRTANPDRLFQVGILFVLCGFIFGKLMGQTEVQFSERGGMTGIATIYLFFGQLVFPGFAICLFRALDRPGLLSISATLVGAIIPLQTIIAGRREPAAMLALMLAMGLYFRRGI